MDIIMATPMVIGALIFLIILFPEILNFCSDFIIDWKIHCTIIVYFIWLIAAIIYFV